ncbi:hypothetical protein [Anthocerotibacter panamensis]|uniref:hypothetical protein n=1 Tax=Anthocerotibacter panamensis TaxID=2857077 RepID=UPI001C405B49|nr:hypothetical protein [Anthocerotibacter panamensis]
MEPLGTPAKKPTVFEALKALGLAGIIGYGIASLFTYSAAFAATWYGYAGAADLPRWQKVLEVFGLMWLASRATQPIRIAGAVLGAPIINQALNSFKNRKPS